MRSFQTAAHRPLLVSARRAANRVLHGMGIGLSITALLSCAKTGDAGARAASGNATSSVLHPPAIGAMAPEFSAMAIDGTPVTLASLRGNVVVLNVWATWCLPCREEIPQLEAAHHQFVAQGVQMIGVSIDAAGMGAEITDFMHEHQMTYPVWLDPDHQFALKFLTVGVPETFLIDKTGAIRWRMIGALRTGDTTLVQAIRSALGS